MANLVWEKKYYGLIGQLRIYACYVKGDALVVSIWPNANQTITLAEDVLAKFRRYRQRGRWSREAGGQLFAKLSDSNILICKATGPRAGDRRGRFYFWPDRQTDNSEIEQYFANGLHYVGDWHTHPQLVPEPSRDDLRSIAECFKKSKHELVAFLMIIVGIDDQPGGLWVGWHDGKVTLRLQNAVEIPIGSQRENMT